MEGVLCTGPSSVLSAGMFAGVIVVLGLLSAVCCVVKFSRVGLQGVLAFGVACTASCLVGVCLV